MLKAMFQAMHVSPRLETLLPTPNIKDDTRKENAVKVPTYTYPRRSSSSQHSMYLLAENRDAHMVRRMSSCIPVTILL